MDSNTSRILSLPGGGARGYLALLFLQRLVQLWGIRDDEIYKYFNVITGTSVGSIMALAIAMGMPLSQMTKIFTDDAPYIFSLSSLVKSVVPNEAAKGVLMAAGTPFYQSSGPTAESYGAGLLYKVAREVFGETTLVDLKTNVVVPVYDYTNEKYVVFSNLNIGDFKGQNFKASDVCLASGAAPIYLPRYVINGVEYEDGGLYQNNPAFFGLTTAKLIMPTNVNRTCLLTVGTGHGNNSFDKMGNNMHLLKNINSPHLKDIDFTGPKSLKLLDWIKNLTRLIGVSTSGSDLAIGYNMKMLSKVPLDQFYDYNFNPKMDSSINTELDATTDITYNYYRNKDIEVFQNDINNITNFIGHLEA
jgi:patatin-like phospholipase/acyl hydrolase